jgi:uncharacterized DUF497 family protein
MPLDIRELEFDDENEGKASSHGVSMIELFQLLDGRVRAFKNRKDRAATHLMIGRTHGGRTITVPIVETAVPGRWRPVTAWPSTDAERARYEQ